MRYARDAFEGLRLMDALINVKRGVPEPSCPPCGRGGSSRSAGRT